MKTKFKLIACLLLLLFIVGCSNQNTDPREEQIVQLVVNEKYDEAISKANELYQGKELEEMIYWINKSKPVIKQSQTNKLEIQSGHTGSAKGDYYYITGRVKNNSNTDINYFEVVCKFLDENDQVLDSDYTNDSLVLKPGEMREFEIMHKYRDEYEKYQLFIGEVK